MSWCGRHCLTGLRAGKMGKRQHCPWRDKCECAATAASEKNVHGKKNSTEIEVYYGKQMEVISDLAWEYGHVTTVPVNLFIEIH